MVPAPAQGIITHAGLGSIRALDDKTETARQVNELLDDENRHRTVGRTAQERVRARDNWGTYPIDVPDVPATQPPLA